MPVGNEQVARVPPAGMLFAVEGNAARGAVIIGEELVAGALAYLGLELGKKAVELGDDLTRPGGPRQPPAPPTVGDTPEHHAAPPQMPPMWQADP